MNHDQEQLMKQGIRESLDKSKGGPKV